MLKSEAWGQRVDAVFLRTNESWEKSPVSSAHAHALRRLFSDVGADAVLCTEGRPAVCILDARDRSDEQIEHVRRKLWNLGATTLLLVETPSQIRLFSTLSTPTRTETCGQHALIQEETISNLEATSLALRLRQLIRRIETGAIYRDHSTAFDSRQTVDYSLLDNLKQARNLICPQSSTEGYQRAHTLIGRFLFSCYLLDRNIIGPSYLAKKNLPSAQDMLGFLSAVSRRGPALESLFNCLHRDFNGSLFGEPFAPGDIEEYEVQILLRLLAGEDLERGQLSLGFKLYDFSYVPVEFISSIYEEFLGAEASAEHPSDAPRKRRRSVPPAKRSNLQRAAGAYYTPPRLAELTVDVATQGWTTLLDKRCFDPACGSGVFLVILFIRMAEEWRSRNPTADTESRYTGLLSILENNLCGMDLQATACLVACFSLYLAFLDQMDPKDILELREALERDARAKILPRILWEQGQPKPRDRNFATVRGGNFFQLAASPEFDLIIGNPPWVSRKKAPEVEAWYARNGMRVEGHSWTDNTQKASLVRQTLFPDREVACAFMWKAERHLTADGRICQLLPARVFLSSNKNRFQTLWLSQHVLETVWFLADYRFILFAAAACPCVIVRYRPRQASDATLGDFDFVTPKVEPLDPRQALLPVLPEDQKIISQGELLDAARAGNVAAAWKRNHWGTPRDHRLLARVMQWPRLSRITKSPPTQSQGKNKRRTKTNTDVAPLPLRTWYTGQGFQPRTDSTTDPKPIFWRERDRFLSADAKVDDLVLLHEETDAIRKRFSDGLHRARNALLYKQPLVLVNKACTKFLFSKFDVLFQDDFQSICGPESDTAELQFLTAYLSSSLARYIRFHTGVATGIERGISRVTEILDLPFPLPDDLPDPEAARRIINNCAECLCQLELDLGAPENLLRRHLLVADAKDRLNRWVFEYFNLSQWERELVADTVEIFDPSSMPASLFSERTLTAAPSTMTERRRYVATLARVFRSWSSSQPAIQASGYISSSSGLALVTLGFGQGKHGYAEREMESRVEDILLSIREASGNEQDLVFRRLRGFAFYEQDQIHMLKPLNRRHWTCTAALNDADEVITRMMEEGGWDA